jgi:hypothetical protein
MATPQVSPKTVPDDLDAEISPRTARADSANHTAKQSRYDRLAYDFKSNQMYGAFSENITS